MSIVIDFDRYGDRMEFNTIGDAQAALRACGEEWLEITLSLHGDDIVNEAGQVVGCVKATNQEGMR